MTLAKITASYDYFGVKIATILPNQNFNSCCKLNDTKKIRQIATFTI